MPRLSAAKRVVNKFLFPLGLEVRRVAPSAESSTATYSYGNEDAIIEELLGKVTWRNKFAVDIGAGDGEFMSNSYRLFKEGWTGIAFEWDGRQFAKLAFLYSPLSNVSLVRGRVTPDNVLHLLAACDAPKEFGYLGLDIDSYDHFVLEKLLSAYRPSVICTEINEKIPPPVRFAANWDVNGSWGKDHFYGQSLSMLEALGKRERYDLVRLEYNNAFLVAQELNSLPVLTAADAFRQGYVERSDRRERFPWNAEMEPVLSMPEADLKPYFEQKFKSRAGHFVLE